MHEIYEGRRTFFVSSPQIKKQRPKKKESFLFIIFWLKHNKNLPREFDFEVFVAGFIMNGRLERIRWPRVKPNKWIVIKKWD
jgi:hypothetical protein